MHAKDFICYSHVQFIVEETSVRELVYIYFFPGILKGLSYLILTIILYSRNHYFHFTEKLTELTQVPTNSKGAEPDPSDPQTYDFTP